MNGTTYRGISSNLSLNGLFIRTRRPFAADTVIDLMVHFPNGSTSKLKGITRRAIRNPLDNQNGMGIELIEKYAPYQQYVKFHSEKIKTPLNTSELNI
jgi:protoheme ferro-lyase